LTVIRSVLPSADLSSGLSKTILTKAEGNPFFLEELALALGDRPGSDHAIPDTVQGVIMARIDRLPEDTKRLVLAASVLGREFPLKLLDRVWDGIGPLHPHLIELTRLEFVYERVGSNEPVYVFKHALTQDVAYDGLLTQRRQSLHGAAARALEELFADRLEEADAALAYHYARSEFADKAVEYLVRVADRAARVYAHAEAHAHLRDALAQVERVPPGRERDRAQLDLVLRQGFSLYFLGNWEESVNLLLRHQKQVAALGDPSLAGRYHFWLAHMYSRMGDQERAEHNARRALEEAQQCGDEATLGKAHGLLALEGHWSGKSLPGIEHGRRAVALLERTTEPWYLGMAHFYIAMNYLTLGRFAEVREAAQRAHAVGEATSDPRLQCYAAFTIGWMDAIRGDADAAREACERSRRLSPDRVSGVYASAFLGLAHVESGDAASATPLLESAVPEFERFRFPQWHGMFTVLLGEAARLSGDSERAQALAAEGIEILRPAQYWYAIGFARRTLGRIAAARGELSRADALFGEALETFSSIGAEFERARTGLEIAALAFERRDEQAARAHLVEAHGAFRALAVPVYLRRATQLATDRGLTLP
jgi:tetratricopeptide (TPR) repeat protein